MQKQRGILRVAAAFMTFLSLFFLAIITPCAVADAAAGNFFNVRDYGAVGNGKNLDSPAIDKAITAAAAGGGGTVLVPAGTYLSGSIHLQSNIHLLIDAGATILGVPQDMNVYAFLETRNLAVDAIGAKRLQSRLGLRINGSLFFYDLLRDAPFAGADELDEMQDFGQRRHFFFNLRQRVGNGKLFAKKNFISLSQCHLDFFGKAVPFQTDLVDDARLSGIAFNDHERRHVLDDSRTAAGHRELADTAELMHRHQPADDRVIFDRDMASERRHV
jgi:hypothetical protein